MQTEFTPISAAPSGCIAVLPARAAVKWIRRLIIVLTLGAMAAPGTAAEKESAARDTQRESMPLKVANRTIIHLRGPIAGHSAKERVANSLRRIEDALAAEHIPAVTLEELDYGTRVALGGKHAFSVTRVDIDETAGETTRLVAREAARRLERAIAERREQETPGYRAMAAASAGLATLVWAVLLWLLIRLSRWAMGKLAGMVVTQARKVTIGGATLLEARSLLRLARGLAVLLAWALGVVLTVAWITLTLMQFPLTQPWGEQLQGGLLHLVEDAAGATVAALPGLMFAVLILLVARLIVRLAETFFLRVEAGKIEVGWVDADTARPTRKIVVIVIWLFGVAMAYPYLPGAQTDAFKGLSVLVGLMISIGASSVVGQAFSGLILMYTRAFRSGEYVRIGDNEGTVVELGMFATRVRTGLGEELTLPNAGIMGGTIKNYSRAVPGTGCVVDTVVTIGYSAPWRQVHAMLEEAARRTPDIARDPAPYVRQTALSDFYVEYRLVAHTPVERPEQRVEVLNHLHENIQDVFNEHGVQIMSPHYMTDTAAPQVVPKDQWYAAPARPPDKQ